MRQKKILFVYRTKRRQIFRAWEKGKTPDSLLFGANHLKNMRHAVDFFDWAYFPLNPMHSLLYPLENTIINQTGMGFKLDQAITLLPILNKYDVIVGTGDSAGLPILALKYYRILKKPVIFMTAGLAGALKNKTNTRVGKFYKKILPCADIFTSYAKVEIDFFENEMGIKRGKIIHIPLCTDFKYFSKKSHLKRNIISSVGTESGRDYKTLFEAVKNLNRNVEIACHPDNIRGLKIPKNVTVHLNIPVEKVRNIYQRSIFTIIPCVEKYRSSGQMVLLETASAGLPIIVSNIKGLTSAFEFKENKHLIFTNPQDPRDLRSKINFYLKNPDKAKKLGRNASSFVKNHYTTLHLAKQLNKFIIKI